MIELRGGTDGNERLTVQTGAVLFVMLAALGLTIVRIGQLMWAHLFIGLLLIGPVLLKLASTGYRFARYYGRDGAYLRKGPPLRPLRLLAPAVVLSTLVVFASGVALLLLGPGSREPLLLVHKASFFVWIAVTAVHVLGHLAEMQYGLLGTRPAASLLGSGPVASLLGSPPAAEPSTGASGRLFAATPLPGRGGRAMELASAIVLGLALALLLIPHFSVWTHFHPHE